MGEELTPEQRAYQIVCDTFGAEKGWEHVTAWIAAAIRAAEAAAARAERERAARVVEGFVACDCRTFCECYGVQDIRDIAAAIRSGGPPPPPPEPGAA